MAPLILQSTDDELNGTLWFEDHGIPCQQHSRHFIVPASFKAARRRKTPQFIREEIRLDRRRLQQDAQRRHRQRLLNPVHRCRSEVDAQLIGDADHDSLIAGVARLIFRHLAESGDDLETATGRFEDYASVGSNRSSAQCSLQQLANRDFHRDSFFVPAECRWLSCIGKRWCWRQRVELLGADPIFTLLKRLTAFGRFPGELVVLSAIYVERFLGRCSVRLLPWTWQPIVVAATLLASKVWEDIHPWNRDFADLLRRAVGLRLWEPLSLYRLESAFLRGLDWHVGVSGEQYAAYLFALRDAAPQHVDTAGNLQAEFSIRRSLSWSAAVNDGPYASDKGLPYISEACEDPALAEVMEVQYQESAAGSCEEEESATAAVLSDTSIPSFPGSSRQRAETGADLDCYFRSLRGYSRRRAETVSGLEDWRIDPSNPFVGSFRHAPHALPPSRHIHMPGKELVFTTSEEDPFLTAGVRWQRAVSD